MVSATCSLIVRSFGMGQSFFFIAAGNGSRVHVTGTMDSLKYQAIWGKSVMPSVCKLKLGYRWTLQQDNHPSLPALGSGMGPGMSLSGHLSLRI